MKKNGVNFKLINVAVGLVILLLLYLTKDVWFGIFSRILSIAAPFIIGFAFAYAVFPLLKFLISKKIPKNIAVALIASVTIAVFTITAILVVPLLLDQLTSLFNNIIAFTQDMSTKFNVNASSFQETLSNSFDNIINSLGGYISTSTIDVVTKSVSFITMALISFIIGIYLLLDMAKIRDVVEKYLKRRNKRTFKYFTVIDKEMNNYFVALGKFIIIQFIEYTLIFFIIGHPNFLLLGVLAALTTIIPYFGGVITNIIALITASVISTQLFVLTLIVALIFPNIDGYIISPRIYSKANKLHPLLIIFAVLTGGALFGLVGIIISLPVTIIITSALKFYKEDINDKIDNIKEKI